jgi:hypothetical protein
VLRNVTQGLGLGQFFGSAYGPVVGHFEDDDESSSYIKGREFLD